jgi:NAD-dependent deacetylase
MTPLATVLRNARRVVAFTGAGVSTESGIPDFRSPGGIWTRYDPMDFTFGKYVDSATVRANSWAMRREFFATPVVPNEGHWALARLEAVGRSPGVITQNIDGLHQDAGSQEVVEVHGTAREVMCIGRQPVAGTPDGCGWTAPYTWAFERLDAGEVDPMCPRCRGLVKSATVSFEQVLSQRTMLRAYALAQHCDVLLAIGSSLRVYPAADLPVLAMQAGADLVIVNDEPTPFDSLATLVVRGRAAEVLGSAVTAALA